jgi:hypothetical protein
MVRVYRKKTGSRTGRKDKSGTILLQFFDIGPEHIRVSIKQGVMSSAAPSPALPSPIPMPTTIHDDEPGEHDVDNPHLDLGFTPHEET